MDINNILNLVTSAGSLLNGQGGGRGFQFSPKRKLGDPPGIDTSFQFNPQQAMTVGNDQRGAGFSLPGTRTQMPNELPFSDLGSLSSTFTGNGAASAIAGGAGGGGGGFNWGKAADVGQRLLGDAAGLANFFGNRREINDMPITQPVSYVEPVLEDKTRRDAAAINDVRRQARAVSLGTTSGSAQREGNIRAAAGANAVNEINKVRTSENLRLDAVGARNAQAGNRANMINAGIFNQQMGDINQNLFTQSQARVQNRQALTDTILGNQFQRANQDLEREKMALIAMRDNDRGTLRRIYTTMLGDENVSETLKQQVESYLGT